MVPGSDLQAAARVATSRAAAAAWLKGSGWTLRGDRNAIDDGWFSEGNHPQMMALLYRLVNYIAQIVRSHCH